MSKLPDVWEWRRMIQKDQKTNSTEGIFEGQINALEGQIYNCTENRQVDLYTTDTKEIAGWSAIPLNRGNVRKAIQDMKVSEMVLPKDLPAAALAVQK